jgi:hypothetical protein
MACYCSSRVFAFLLAAGLCLTANPLQAQRGHRHKPVQKKKVEPAPPESAPAATADPVQLTLEQQPAVPPKVTYQGGKLTIVAENSTLGDILREVRAQTGAMVEVPANANERVVSHVGPGPAREVLASLLNGSSFNYVILGTTSEPHRLDRVILSPRPPGGVTPPVAAYQPYQAQNQVAGQAGTVNINGDQADDSDQAEEYQGDETAEEPSPGAPEASGAQPGNAQGIKTPEQLLQELQRQQQLLQQQQLQQLQGINPANQPQPQPDSSRQD